MTKKKRKILVTGASGTVGSYIASIFSDDALFLPSRHEMDIADKEQVTRFFDDIHPMAVIHLAAKTNVDECEKNTDEANRVNAQGTQNIAEECKKNGVILIYISTGAVFNGKKKYFTEPDKPDPINVYGKTKLLGEKAVQELVKNHVILRAGWVVGGANKEKKFISYILKQINDGAKEINIVNDTFGTLTYAKELVQYIKILLDTDAQGIYHFGSTGSCSRYEIAKHLVNLLQKDVAVNPVASSFFADKFFAPRPINEVIKSIKLPKQYAIAWQKSLTNYIMGELI
jgi:dTDP-4-dehydrorhamnose reductase